MNAIWTALGIAYGVTEVAVLNIEIHISQLWGQELSERLSNNLSWSLRRYLLQYEYR